MCRSGWMLWVALAACGSHGNAQTDASSEPATQGRIFVADKINEALLVVDATTNQVVASIPLGTAGKVAVDPAASRAYVAYGGGSDVVALNVIDTASNMAIASIPYDSQGTGSIAIDLVHHKAYIAESGVMSASNPGTSTLFVIDLATQSVAKTVPLGVHGVTGIAVSETANEIYVSAYGSSLNNFSDSALAVVDGSTYATVATIGIPGGAMGVAYDPSRRVAYIARGAASGDPTGHELVSPVSMVSRTVSGSIDTGQQVPGSSAVGIAVDPELQRVLVTDDLLGSLNTGAVTIIDTAHASVVQTLRIGSQDADDVAIDPSTHLGYVTSMNSQTVSVIDEARASVTTTIGVPGGGPSGIAVAPLHGTAGGGDAGPPADAAPAVLLSDDFSVFPSAIWGNNGGIKDNAVGDPAPSLYLMGGVVQASQSFPLAHYQFSIDVSVDLSMAAAGDNGTFLVQIPSATAGVNGSFSLIVNEGASGATAQMTCGQFSHDAVTVDAGWHHVVITVSATNASCTWDGTPASGVNGLDSSSNTLYVQGGGMGKIAFRADNALLTLP